jgi:hypothetical protein
MHIDMTQEFSPIIWILQFIWSPIHIRILLALREGKKSISQQGLQGRQVWTKWGWATVHLFPFSQLVQTLPTWMWCYPALGVVSPTSLSFLVNTNNEQRFSGIRYCILFLSSNQPPCNFVYIIYFFYCINICYMQNAFWSIWCAY